MPAERTEFEIHITVDDKVGGETDSFAKVCAELGGKALLIELAEGETRQQMMLNKNVFEESLEQTLKISQDDCKKLLSQGFGPSRIKIEMNSEAECLPERSENNYFEWHGKIELKTPEKLAEVCRKHQAHLSKNALKGETDFRFITLREFGGKEVFDKRRASLVVDLRKSGCKIAKQRSELCLFDSNISLDAGWID